MIPTDAPALNDRIFLLLLGVILALLAVAVLFTLLTLVLRRRHNRIARLWASLEARWEPVLLDVLVGARSPGELQDLVAPGEALRFVDYVSRFARRVSGGEVRVLEELVAPYLGRLREEYRSRGTERRARAVQTLGLLGMGAHGELVREALDDESPLVSIIAARALARSGHPEAVQGVLDRLERYALWHPSFLAGLLAEGGAEAAPALRAALADDQRPAASRTVVAHALRELRDPPAADTACAVLSATGDTDLLVACLRVVAEMGEGRHRDAVVPLLDSPHFQVRSYALNALRTVGEPDDLHRFLAAMEDASPWVALEAARGVRDLGAGHLLQGMAASGRAQASLARQVMSE